MHDAAAALARGSVHPVFERSLHERLPLRAERIFNGLREMRAGKVNTTTFGQRHLGTGQRWQMAQQLYRLYIKNWLRAGAGH